MLIYSMSVSVDGFIADRDGGFAWTAPDDEQFAFSLAQISELGGYLCGRRLYETMRVWETDESLGETEAGAAFAAIWRALPKVVFSRTLDHVTGNARLARGSLLDEVAAAEEQASGGQVSIGGAGLASAALRAGLVDEFRLFRDPVVVGGGTPYFPSLADPLDLELLETRTFASRVVYERYRRADPRTDRRAGR